MQNEFTTSLSSQIGKDDTTPTMIMGEEGPLVLRLEMVEGMELEVGSLSLSRKISTTPVEVASWEM